MYERLLRLISAEEFSKLTKAHILLIGVGGVGGYVLENLVRSGIQKMTLIDFDTIEESNLNRQILATSDNLGNYKVEEAKKRVLSIAKDCQVEVLKMKLDADCVSQFDFSSYDYVIDACDDVEVKVGILLKTCEQHVPVISSMGTGNRFSPWDLTITTLAKTHDDALAKRVRYLIRKTNPNLLTVPVLWSREHAQRVSKLGSFCAVPMAAGAMIAAYVVQELLKKDDL